MINFWTKLRLKLFLISHTLGYTSDYLERVYQIYLNHHKIIHFRRGYPVYSLSTPALYSKPAANFFARLAFRTIQNKNTPSLMSFAVNDKCNANCKHCSFFTAVDNKKRKVLSTQQCQELISDAQILGVSVINFVGGEPLLRDDLPEIIQYVDKDLSTTILFTNGWFLAEKIPLLKKAGLDSIYVSLDSAEAKKHDLIRGKDGMFNKAAEGINAALANGFSVGISSCLTEKAFREGEMRKIIELGKKIGIHEVLFFDALPTGRYKDRCDLQGNQPWVEEMIVLSKTYNDNPSYPSVLIYAYTSSYRSVGCSGGVSYFYVNPYGDINPCDFYHENFGNFLKTPLYLIWDKMTTSPAFNQARWAGCLVKNDHSISAKSKCSHCLLRD